MLRARRYETMTTMTMVFRDDHGDDTIATAENADGATQMTLPQTE